MDERRQTSDSGNEITLPTSATQPQEGAERRWLEYMVRLATFSSEHGSLVEVVRYTYELIKPLLGPDAFMVSLYHSEEDESEHIYAVVDNHEVSLRSYKVRNKLPGSRIEPMVRNKSMMLVDNWQAEEQHNYQVVSLGQNPPRVHTLLDIPFVVGNDVLGGLHLQSYRYKAWNSEEVEFARVIASVLTGAVLKQRIANYRSRKKSYASCLHQVSRECSMAAPVEEIYTKVIEIVARFIGGICTLVLKQQEEIKLVALFHSDPVMRMIQTEFAKKNMDMMLEAGWAMPLQTGEAILIANAGEGKTDGQKWMMTSGISTTAAAPLRLRGQVIGQIGVARFAPDGPLHDYDVRLLESTGVYLALAIENEELRAGR